MKSRISLTPFKGTKFIDGGENDKGYGYGANFYYSVTAVDSSNNESDLLNIVVSVPDVEAPLPPNHLKVVSKGNYLFVDCGMSPSLDANLYTLYRSEEKQKNVKLYEYKKAPFQFIDTTIVKGKKYVYSVMVTDTAGNISKTSIMDSVVFADFSPPPAPRNVNAKFINGKVELNWIKSIDFDMAGYNIYRSDYPTGTFELLNKVILTETKFTDNSGNNKFYYRIRAIDTSGNESKYDKTVSPK
jgi:fibronectin type 3 domain-containing protein